MGREAIHVLREPAIAGVELHCGNSVTRVVDRHWHSEFQFCIITGGGGELIYRGQRYPTPAGTMFAIAPGETHANETRWTEGCSYRTLNLEPHIVERLTGQRDFWPMPLISDAQAVRTFRGVCAAMAARASVLQIESGLMDALSTLGDHATPRVRNSTVRANRAVEMVREYLRAHHARNVSLPELAELVGLSAFHLVRCFTLQFGMPPHRFQTQVRLEHAKRLLRQDWNVANVAAECGFADQSHLVRHFKRTFGIPPREYRASVARTF